MLHQKPIIKNIEFALRHRCQVKPGDRLLLAISGGADSTALLRAMKIIAERPHWQLELHACHLNHHLRPTADEEATFVQDCCDTLQIPCTIHDIHPDKLQGNLEANARKLRYDTLFQQASTIHADAILTAHHADDQLETLLMRLIRGTGPQGLSGIHSRRMMNGTALLRPLLNLEHADLVEFLNELEQAWCEDESNADTTRTRAKLRHDVIPLLKELRPDASLKANASAEQIHKANTVINALAQKAEQHLSHTTEGDEVYVPREKARKMRASILDRLLRQCCHRLHLPGDQLPARVMEQIIMQIQSKSGETKVFELSDGIRVKITREQVRLYKANS